MLLTNFGFLVVSGKHVSWEVFVDWQHVLGSFHTLKLLNELIYEILKLIIINRLSYLFNIRTSFNLTAAPSKYHRPRAIHAFFHSNTR